MIKNKITGESSLVFEKLMQGRLSDCIQKENTDTIPGTKINPLLTCRAASIQYIWLVMYHG